MASDQSEDLTTEVTELKEKCPAFKEKCPFDTQAAHDLKEQAKECPAFKDGCLFENSFSIQDVYEKLSRMPDVKDGSPHQKALVEILKLIHSVSSELKQSFGECPKFSTQKGCMFKTICADGKPLMQKLENYTTGAIVTKSVIELKDELNSSEPEAKKEIEVKHEKEGEEKHDNNESIHLANELKKGTMKVHRQAERVHFVKEFIKGRVEQKIYREAVASLYYIYTALEDVSNQNADHPLFKNIHFPKELSRVESLKEDLLYYYGEDWEEEISMSDATKKYVEHIQDIGKRDPQLLISHHYTRYLGDLSGGQILKKMAVKAYELPENGDGVRFYEFKNIPDPVEFKDAYRSKLDGLKVDQETASKLVKEAEISFGLNIQLFKELDRLAGFEEEIVHDEVETVQNTGVQRINAKSQSDGGKAKHVTKQSPHWLRVLAAVAVAISVLVALILNLMGKR